MSGTYEHTQCGYQGDDFEEAPEGEQQATNHLDEVVAWRTVLQVSFVSSEAAVETGADLKRSIALVQLRRVEVGGCRRLPPLQLSVVRVVAGAGLGALLVLAVINYSMCKYRWLMGRE